MHGTDFLTQTLSEICFHEALKWCSGHSLTHSHAHAHAHTHTHTHTHQFIPDLGSSLNLEAFWFFKPQLGVLFQTSGTISVLLDTMNLTDKQIYLPRVWLGLLCSHYAVWKRTGNGVWGEVEDRRLRPLFSSTLITWNSGNCAGSISDAVYPFRNNHLISLPSPGAVRALNWSNPIPLSLSLLHWLFHHTRTTAILIYVHILAVTRLNTMTDISKICNNRQFAKD